METWLLITNADINLQSGNIVLINRRAEEFFKQFKIKTICLVTNKKCNKNIEHKIAGIEYSTISNKQEIRDYIITFKPQKIILYGAKTYLYLHFIKKIISELDDNIDLILDVQGALEERIEYSKGIQFIKNYPKYLLERKMLSFAINSVSGAFVVSDELEEYCYSFLKNKKEFKSNKFRCGINDVINTEQKIQWRNRIRKQWGIDEDTIVFTFSGYRMPWQNIDKIIEIFKEYDKKIEKIFFAFFCNIDEEFEKKMKADFPNENYMLKFLSFDEYFKFLSACDVGFLIRDYNVTNKVAFPNKFSDYLNAGLLVAINKALPEPYRVCKKSDLEFIDIEKDSINSNINKILRRQKEIIHYYKEAEEICRQELQYSTQISKYKGNIKSLT